MHRILIIGATVAIAAAAAAAALGQGRGATVTNLKGTVGPGYSISLTKAGKKVKTLKPGTYKITVTDKSSMHNFTLKKRRSRTSRSTSPAPASPARRRSPSSS